MGSPPTKKPTAAPTTSPPTKKPTEAPTTSPPTKKTTAAPTTSPPTKKSLLQHQQRSRQQKSPQSQHQLLFLILQRFVGLILMNVPTILIPAVVIISVLVINITEVVN